MSEKYQIGDVVEFKQSLTTTNSAGKSTSFKKGDKAWYGADGKMHTINGVDVVGDFETVGDINISGVADYLMTKMFGKYDAGSHNIAYIYTDLLKGLSEILLTKTQRTEEITPLKKDMGDEA